MDAAWTMVFLFVYMKNSQVGFLEYTNNHIFHGYWNESILIYSVVVSTIIFFTRIPGKIIQFDFCIFGWPSQPDLAEEDLNLQMFFLPKDLNIMTNDHLKVEDQTDARHIPKKKIS